MRRFIKKRRINGMEEIYDSYINQWVSLSTVLMMNEPHLTNDVFANLPFEDHIVVATGFDGGISGGGGAERDFGGNDVSESTSDVCDCSSSDCSSSDCSSSD